MDGLPIALDDLINATAIESERREFKQSWNDVTKPSVLRTISAFANDLHNLNGGYVVIGIEEVEGRPVLPPFGLGRINLDRIQKEIRGACQRIEPVCQPAQFVVTFQEQLLLILWVPGGDARPYTCPESLEKGGRRKHYVRIGSETVEAKGELLTQLLELTAKVPFDDRRRPDAPISLVDHNLLLQFLADIKSDLRQQERLSTAELLRALRLSIGTNGSVCPKNAALLFFTRDPDEFFPGARIELVQFGDDAGGDLIEERTIRGPLPQQIRELLQALSNLTGEVIRKVPGKPESQHYVGFPFEAMEEAVSNAILHRSYESPPEPTKVYLYPDRLEIISYPGPVPGVRLVDLQPGSRPPQAPMRNRRIGEFLKELRLAEMRSTGIPKIRRRMQENGSPEPIFEFDEQRTFFRVVLPAHPDYVVLHALREAASLWATGERSQAIRRLKETRSRSPYSGAIVSQLIDYLSADGDLPEATGVFEEIRDEPRLTQRHLAFSSMARAYIEGNDLVSARQVLDQIPPPPTNGEESLELAILLKRSGDFERSHRLFAESQSQLQNNAKAVHEFAQTKMKLASKAWKDRRNRHGKSVAEQLNRQALELLRTVVQLHESPTRTAWAWFDMAKVCANLKEPESKIRDAIGSAIKLLPHESRFRDWINERFPGQPPFDQQRS